METTPISSAPRGATFARAVQCLAAAGGAVGRAMELADLHFAGSAILKSAISAATVADSQWAGELARPDWATAEFSEILRSGSILGKLNGVRRVPFNVAYARETASTSFSWVGEGRPGKLSKMQLSQTTMGFAKVSGLVVITAELARLASPEATRLVQDDLTKTAIEFLDQQFIDPSVYAVSHISPASITSNITPTQSTGSTAALIAADLATVAGGLADNDETDALYWIVTRADAIRLAAKRDTAGGPAFPTVTANGGTLLGIPVIVSNSVPHSTSAGSIVVLVNASGIDIAEDNNVGVAASSNATVEMSDDPSNDGGSPTPNPTTVVSMFQTDSLCIRLTRFANWVRVRDTAVAYLDNVHW